MPEKRILLVHPYDKTTTFLDRVKNHLVAGFENDLHYFSIKPNDESHNQCLQRMVANPKDGIIIFLGHGRSDKLFGSKADDYSPFADPDAVNEYPERFYYNDNFINEDNIEVFAGKKIFCLACNSNEDVAQCAIDKGARSFLGFGDIPTSFGEFADRNENVGGDVVKLMKTEINYVVKTSLFYSLTKNMSMESLLELLRFVTNQRITFHLTEGKAFKERHVLTDYLYYFQKEAVVYGDKKAKLIG